MNNLSEDLKKYNVEKYKPLSFFALSLATCGIYGIVKLMNRNWNNNYKFFIAIKFIRKNNFQVALNYLSKVKIDKYNMSKKDEVQARTYIDLIDLIGFKMYGDKEVKNKNIEEEFDYSNVPF